MEKLRSWKFNRIAIGNVLNENMFEQWLKEMLTGFNRHVKYVHTKYMLIDPLSDDPLVVTGSANFSDASTTENDENMLIDPLSDDPLVVTGSANFSDASTTENDENMLIIRGDTRVADIYLTEFMRLFMHFFFRSVVNGIGPAKSDPSNGLTYRWRYFGYQI